MGYVSYHKRPKTLRSVFADTGARTHIAYINTRYEILQRLYLILPEREGDLRLLIHGTGDDFVREAVLLDVPRPRLDCGLASHIVAQGDTICSVKIPL